MRTNITGPNSKASSTHAAPEMLRHPGASIDSSRRLADEGQRQETARTTNPGYFGRHAVGERFRIQQRDKAGCQFLHSESPIPSLAYPQS